MEVYRIDWINLETQETEMVTIHCFESGAKGEIDYMESLFKSGKCNLVPKSDPYKYEIKNLTLMILLDNSDCDSLIVGLGQFGI